MSRINFGGQNARLQIVFVEKMSVFGSQLHGVPEKRIVAGHPKNEQRQAQKQQNWLAKFHGGKVRRCAARTQFLG